ncbi:hypothetical protein C4J81_00755 [Deltaproteobacteria bacterium Smac51]|nr:hypothetical protein C4J81_00755 [Deltaproteobacteria bacterium Smac51]
MCKKMLTALAALFLFSAQAVQAVPPKMADYEAGPFLLSQYSTPLVMMVLAKDHKMFYRAYNNLSDLDNDTVVDIGFKPSIEYYGYFDPYSCYIYKDGRFIRAGAAKAQTGDEAEARRNSAGVPPDVAAPASKCGVCSTGDQWSGNWLNYTMTSRMDSIRRVLYGGKRSVDTTGSASAKSRTVLEHSYLPHDAHVWGVEVVSDNLWAALNPFAPYYDVSLYTAYAKPTAGSGENDGNLLFFARVSDSDTTPYLLAAPEVRYDGPGSERLWDWALGEAPIPNPSQPWTKWPSVDRFNAKVEVCDINNMGSHEEASFCRLYSQGNSKPIGLLQRYGDQDKMMFGLLTGSFGETSRRKGGLLRSRISSISEAVDGNGVVKKGVGNDMNIIQAIDTLQITGWYKNADGSDCKDDWSCGYRNGKNWDSPSQLTTFGNPVGEMVYEAVRYFAAKDSPTSAYDPGGSEKHLSLPRPEWSIAPIVDCASPIIMIISDIYPEFDSDDLPGSPYGSFGKTDISESASPSDPDAAYTPPLSTLTGQDFGSFDMKSYLGLITKAENYNGSGRTFFYGQNAGGNPSNDGINDSRNTCSAKSISNLADVRGLCPADPVREGSYSVAAVAYYGHTHDFSGTGNDRPLTFYSVAMDSAFPPLSFDVGDNQVTVMPIALSSSTWDSHFTGFINYYFAEWHADVYNNPFQVKIITNYEDQFEGSDYDRDALGLYTVTLLVDKPAANGTTEKLSEAGIIINSGEFQGRENELYRYKNIMGTAGQAGTKAEIVPEDVAGLLIEMDLSGSTAQLDMLVGYTINGTTQDSTYMDVGHAGSNHSYNLSYDGWLDDGMPFNYNGPDKISWARPARIDNYNSPWGCLNPKLGGEVCKKTLSYRQARSFKFATTPSTAEVLPDPLWLAAKYGGFNDSNNNGLPDQGEWERYSGDSGSDPANYFRVSNMNRLAAQLEAAFAAASRNISTGTATSASINSVLGGGVSIQTMYYTAYEDTKDKEKSTTWAGNVYGLFVDRWGNMREDSLVNSVMDLATGEKQSVNPEEDVEGDLVVQILDDSLGNSVITRHWDVLGTNDLGDVDEAETVESINDLKYLWNVSRWLSELKQSADAKTDQVTTSRAYSAIGGRTVFSYYPMEQLNALEPGGWNYQNGPVTLDTDIFRFNDTRAAELAPWLLLLNVNSEWVIAPKDGGPNRIVLTMDSTKLPYQGATSIEFGEVVFGPSGTNKDKLSISGTVADDVLTINLECLYASTSSGKGVQPGTLISLINNSDLPISASLQGDNQGKNWRIDNQFDLESTVVPDVEAARRLINYILGLDRADFRPRTVSNPWSKANDAGEVVWRMGDIINSRPIIVGSPIENYDILYGDPSYYTFKKNVATRRQMAYFGSNGGLLHAVNLGFYGSLRTGQAGYAVESTSAGRVNSTKHALGAELWAYAPTAVLPHLQWLSKMDYNHSYYVDLTPHIVDIKNTGNTSVGFSNGSQWQPGTWRTVLIGGLRLGGRSIEAPDQFYDNGEQRYSHCEYFALDITDPEVAPSLLWRYSSPELGLSTSQPTVVANQDKWYVVLASGPTYDAIDPDTGESTGVTLTGGNVAYDGYSNQHARLIVLDALTGRHIRELKVGSIEDELNPAADIGPGSFFNDSFTPIVPNYLVNHKRVTGSPTETDWSNHVAYFGLTTSRDPQTGLDKGALYRLKMVSDRGDVLDPADWKLARFINTDRPVTGAVNSSYDSNGNLWVLFGTGRLWSRGDVTPCVGLDDEYLAACHENHTQYLFGLKEPMNGDFMTFGEITGGLLDVSSYKVYSSGKLSSGDEVGDNDKFDNYTGLASALKGLLGSHSYNGYKRRLSTWSILGDTGTAGNVYEMCVTQPKIDGLGNGNSLMAFTTYEPSQNKCDAEGRSYLHLADTFTGLPTPYMGAYDLVPDSNGEGQVSGFMNAGSGHSTEAWMIKTDEGLKIGTTGQNSSIHSLFIPEGGLNTEDPDDDDGGGSSSGDGSPITGSVISWREVLDMGFTMSDEDLVKGLENTESEANK